MRIPICTTILILILSVIFYATGCDNHSPKPPYKPIPSHSSNQTVYRPSVVVPPAPTPADHVRKAMNLLVEYHNLFIESADRAGSRMQNRTDDFSGVVGGFGDVRSVSEASARYIQNAQSIDISNCPADFQARFNAYIQSETEILRLASGITHPSGENGILGDFIGGLVSIGLGGEQAQQERDAAMAALYDLADQKYGVRFVSKQ